MKLYLYFKSGPSAGMHFELPAGKPFIVGRGSSSDTKLDDARMSREHCSLTVEWDGAILVRDLGSSGGTFINERRIESDTIWKGFEFSAGESTAVILSEEEVVELRKPSKPSVNRTDAASLLGKRFAGYELEALVGKGATGVIFKASHVDTGRVVAVKVLHPSFAANENDKLRFVRAMKTMMPIKHPHVIRLYDAGRRGPFCWYAMQYIDGDSLATVIEKIGIDGMLGWKEVWRIAMHITTALKAAYTDQIVHRNLTPTNIIRRTKDKTSFLADLMLSKALDVTIMTQITRPGQLIGDLAYMSPEQTVENGKVDSRSDMYGLGATCYALLTGQPPASGETLPEILDNIRNTEPLPPREFQLAVDDLFQGLIMKLLEKDPTKRFGNPELLLMELERVGRYKNLKIEN